MLSYLHAYHAGNLADVHKHAALAWMLDAMAAKPKALSYLESHAGRGLYDLGAAEALRTGEAAGGIGRVAGWFGADDPYARALAWARARHGGYPGSPLIAAALLRAGDAMTLAELHPREHEALAALMGTRARVERRDGLEMAVALAPPTPRRGVLVVDPSWEVKEDYEAVPAILRQVHRKWNVGVLLLWYPLIDGRHEAMARALAAAFPEGVRHEVRFAPVRAGHGLTGSGLFVVNPPWGLDGRLGWLSERFAALASGDGPP